MTRPPAYTPTSASPFAWPDGFGTRFAVFVDTEEEFDWNAAFHRDARSVTAIGALPDLHARFAARGVPLTYLVDHPVATSPAAVDTLRRLIEDGSGAIGAHLHPWVNPPHEEAVDRRHSFAGNLPPALEAAKLDVLGEAIERSFDVRPRIYRAGRYGIGPATLTALVARGYLIDTSMRSGFSYVGEGGPDFRAIDNHAFRTGPDDAILELPLTTIYVGGLRRGGEGLYDRLGRVPKGRGVASRLSLMERVALTPEQVPLRAVLRAIDRAVSDGVRLLNFSFHSPTIVPGMTPYVRDQQDLGRFHAWWDAVLDRLAARGVMPVGAAELIRIAQETRTLVQPQGHPLGGANAGRGL